MIAAMTLLGAIALQQAQVAPPLGSSSELQSLFLQTKKAIERRDFAQATQLSEALPRFEVNFIWDDKLVSPNLKEAFAAARKAAVDGWTKRLPEVKLNPKVKANIKVSFSREPVRSGAAFFLSTNRSEPRLEIVIGLTRSGVPIVGRDVMNEVMHGIGLYLGVAPVPNSFSVMNRSEKPYTMDHMVMPGDARIARECVEASTELRKLVMAKKPVDTSVPVLKTDTQVLTFDPPVQGETVRTSIAITNLGNALLKFSLVPDCGCFSIQTSGEVQPGQTSLIKIGIDTIEFPGIFDKQLFLYSNDPDQSYRVIPVKAFVRPKYWISPESRSPVLIADENGVKHDFFVGMGEGVSWKVTGTQLAGVKGIAEVSEARVKVPVTITESREMPGFKVTLLAGPQTAVGRVPGTIYLLTDDPLFPEIRVSYFVQNGIVSSPASIFLGDMAKQTIRARAKLTRPGKPFSILSVSSGSPNIKATLASKGRADEHVLALEYDGKAPWGSFETVVTVKTDDPKQPEVRVRVHGTVH